MARTAMIVLAVAALFSGSIVFYVMFSFAQDTGEDIGSIATSPAGQEPTLTWQGPGAVPVEEVHIVIVQGGQFLRVPQIALTQQVGDHWEPEEPFCIAGDGCVVPWTEALQVQVGIRDHEPSVFDFGAPASSGLEAPGPEDLPEAPSPLF